jgi:hypothetical protein
MTNKPLHWFSVKPLPGAKPPSGTRAPQWHFSAAINDNGIVFAPAAIVGNEQRIMLCAAFDGGPAVIKKGHVYLPTDWLIKEFPDWAEVFRAIERRAKKEITTSEPDNG